MGNMLGHRKWKVRRLGAALCGAIALAACQPSGGGSSGGGDQALPVACPAATAAACETTRNEIAELERRRDTALSANDAAAVARLSLAINYKTERLALLTAGDADGEAVERLDSKYRQLTLLLERELKENEGGSEPDDKHPTDLIYHPLEVDAVARVYRDFGELYIAETGRTAEGAPRFEEIAVPMPWSGYWYPLSGTELFDGDQAPLVKLDRVMAQMGRPLQAAAKEREYRDFAAEDSWEGRCFAWATASVTSAEPRAPVEVEGVIFSIQDQKALLTKVHELYPSKVYGIRYDGDAQTDGTLQDIRPEAFHSLFMAVLVKQRRPFIVDDDPGIEVWSKPVYRMRWSIQKDPETQDAFLVDALPFMVGHRTAETDAPTSTRDRTAPAYRYRLYVDPYQVVDGKLKVIAGEWLGESRQSHPDSIAVAEPSGAIGSSNTEINTALDVVRRIVGQSDPD